MAVIIASTPHFAYPRRDGQAELAWVCHIGSSYYCYVSFFVLVGLMFCCWCTLSSPVQLIAWIDLSPEWPVMCCAELNSLTSESVMPPLIAYIYRVREKRAYSFPWITLTNLNIFLQFLAHIIPRVLFTKNMWNLLSKFTFHWVLVM